jgi:predicted esterase
MKKNLQISISGRFSSSPKKRLLIALIGLFGFAVVGVIGFTWIQSPKKVVFDGKTLDDLAALEEIVTAKVGKKQLAKMSEEEREAFEKARTEAEIAWGKYREHYLQQMKEANVERAKQGKELYQEFVIPRGTATYMSFAVKIEDLHAGVRDGGNCGPMRYRYFVPEISEGEKAPLILFLHGTDWQRVEFPRNGTNNYYQFREPEILAFVQPVAQKKYPCFLVAPQQINGTPWCSPPGSSPSYELKNAVGIVDELMAKYPQIDPKRLYVTGVHSGGAGALEAVAKYPNKFAAVVSMSGGRDPAAFGEKQKTTAWISYCEGEPPGVTEYSDLMFKLFSSWGGDSRLVVYPGEGRMSWEYGYVDKNLYAWLFKQSL